jgi:hypothetical protein
MTFELWVIMERHCNGNKTNTDKSINWNKCLVMEVLADVYLCVIQQLIQRSKENNNSDDDIAYIYRAIPDYRKITNHWDLISDPFFNQLKLKQSKIMISIKCN